MTTIRQVGVVVGSNPTHSTMFNILGVIRSRSGFPVFGKKHLMRFFHFYASDRWWGQAVCPLRWPSLTKDWKTEHELKGMNKQIHDFDQMTYAKDFL